MGAEGGKRDKQSVWCVWVRSTQATVAAAGVNTVVSVLMQTVSRTPFMKSLHYSAGETGQFDELRPFRP